MDETTPPSSPQPKNNTLLWVIIALLVLGGIAAFAMRRDTVSDGQANASPTPTSSPNTQSGENHDASPSPSVTVSPSPSATPSAGGGQSGGTAGSVPSQFRAINVKGSNYAFDVKEIKVKKGDKVRIVFTNTSGFHDWVIDEFNAKTAQIPAGQTQTIEFTADKTGTFEYYCSVGSHRQMGMKGNLIVE